MQEIVHLTARKAKSKTWFTAAQLSTQTRSGGSRILDRLAERGLLLRRRRELTADNRVVWQYQVGEPGKRALVLALANVGHAESAPRAANPDPRRREAP